jgi:hypothetical protein
MFPDEKEESRRHIQIVEDVMNGVILNEDLFAWRRRLMGVYQSL